MKNTEYWLSVMEANVYQLVAFNDPNYLSAVTHDIDPVPDRLIRLFMTLISTDAPAEIDEPALSAAKAIVREGFTAVDWGGR